MMIGQALSLVLAVAAKRRILAVHFSENPRTLAAGSEATPARMPAMRQRSTCFTLFAGFEIPANFPPLESIAHGKLVATLRQTCWFFLLSISNVEIV